MRLQVVDIDVEALETEVSEGVHFFGRGHDFLAGHDEERTAEFGQLLEEGSLLRKAAEGRAGGAMEGIEMGLERKGAAIERGFGEIEIVTGQRDDDRET